MTDTLIMLVDNNEYLGFKEVAVLRSIESGPYQFEVTAAPGNDRSGIYDLEDGMACQIFINDDLVLTGAIDDVNVDYDATTNQVSIVGRSTLGDLVDCSTTGMQIKPGQSLADVARLICKPYGISVTIAASAATAANEPFTTSNNTLDAGQFHWEFLEQLARMRGVLLVSSPEGGLVITRSGASYAHTGLVLGKNIKACQARRSHRSLFSEYLVCGQQSLFATSDTEANSQPKAKEPGDAKRYRPFTLHADNPADNGACQARAQWQRRVNYGRSRSVVYTVQGWRQDNGQLWLPNQLTTVTDARNKLQDAERLVVAANLQLTEKQGRTTSLTVMPAAAFDLLAEPEESNGDLF